MANEFIIRKGFKSLQDSQITGSLNLSGDLEVLGSISGDITGSATTASYIELSNVDGSASLASRIFDNSSSIASLETVSGSYANSSSFASDISANSSSIGSLNAVSSSYLLNTTDTLTGDLTVTGNIIATTLNVQDVTASVVYSSGSNVFGSSSIDTQQFTGSILTSGSIEVNGDKFTVSGATGDTNIAGTTIINDTLYLTEYVQHLGNTSNNIRFTTDAIAISANSTFAGKILVGTGATAAASINAFTTTVSTNLFSALRVIENSGASSYWDIGATGGANTSLNFYHNANTTPKINFTHLGGATFAGNVGIGDTPSEKLTIDGTTSGAYVRISNAASGDISSGYTIYNGSNLDYAVYTNPTFSNTTLLSREALAIRAGSAQRMYIRADGGVAIGEGNTGYSSQILSIKSGAADNVFYGESTDANCFASFRDSNSTANIEFGAIGDNHVFRKDAAEQIRINVNGDIYNVPQTNNYQSTFFGINTGNQSASTGLYNQAFGYEVSRLNTTGEKNTGMGHRALYNSTVSSRNTAIGYQTLYNLNAAGSDNTALGYAAGSSLQNAERNIFVGGFCGASTSTGASYNTAMGYHALRYGETNQNTAIGYFAMGTSTSVTGGLNTAVGIRSQEDLTSGVNNCALGADALRSITTGSNNIGIGYNVLGDLTVGQANVCIGREAGYGGDFGETVFIGHYAGQNNTQSGTVGIGTQALQNNTNIQNVAVGYQALLTNTSGARNTSLGYKSLLLNVQGEGNTAIGNQTLQNATANYNVVVGDRAGFNISGGSSNVAIGYLALSGGNGSNCIAIGYNALSSDGTFEESIAIGDNALATQTSGRNHAFGYRALQDLTSGNYNTAVGGECMENVTTGTVNTGIGTFALRLATDAAGQTAVGYQALYTSNGNGNVGMGQQAGYSISTGTFNIVIGHECGYGLTGGNNNVLIGDRAGRVLASGTDNVFIGTWAGYNRTGGNENTFVGEKANGIGIGTGNNNTGLGRFVGYKLTSGTKNTFIGHQSGLEATTADNSTFVGKNAGSLVTTGDNNTFIGEEAGSNVTIGDNNVCLGKDSATPSNSSTNTIVLGNSLIQSLQCQVQTISGLSDERDKTNIKNSEYGLDLINSLRPVTFEWNQRDGKKIGKKDLGFIAQDLQKIDDKHLSLVNDENPEKLLASYGRLIPVLVKSIQELTARVKELENN